jgi:hypothetical protein
MFGRMCVVMVTSVLVGAPLSLVAYADGVAPESAISSAPAAELVPDRSSARVTSRRYRKAHVYRRYWAYSPSGYALILGVRH